MDRSSPIRYIITNNSLMEGWDCPFAYMLVILDNMTSRRSLTQLLGRVMRQPDTQYMGHDQLDHCYVYCIHEDIQKVIQFIQKQLASEGYTGMGGYVRQEEESERRTNSRREKYSGLNIRLPKVPYKDGSELDYDRHILYQIDWNGISAGQKADMAGLGRRNEVLVNTGTGDYSFVTADVSGRKPKLSEWVAGVSELVPNAWQAARMITEFWKSTGLLEDVIYANEEELQGGLLRELRDRINQKAGTMFREMLGGGTIRFDLKAPGSAYKMRGEYEMLKGEGQLLERQGGGKPVQASLFEPVYDDFQTNPERNFAKYLDDAEAIEWWHRVAAKGRGEYYLRGWKKDKIYPDFIAVFSRKNERMLRIYEIKGRQLENPDAEYKLEVFEALQEVFAAGRLSVTDGSIRGEFAMLFDDEVRERPDRLRRGPAAKATDFPSA